MCSMLGRGFQHQLAVSFCSQDYRVKLRVFIQIFYYICGLFLFPNSLVLLVVNTYGAVWPTYVTSLSYLAHTAYIFLKEILHVKDNSEMIFRIIMRPKQNH